MASVIGTKIIEDGLVFHYDMGNSEKSWKGKPTTNFFTNGHFLNGQGVSQESGSAPTNQIVLFPYNPGDSQYVLRQNGANAEYQINLTTELLPSTTYVMSGWFAVSNDYNGLETMFHSRAYSTSGANVTIDVNIGSVITTKVINGLTWKYCYKTITTPSDYNNVFNWYVGYGTTNTTGYRYYTNLQMELGNYPSRFTNGTRTNTQAILDLTGTNTVSVNLDYTDSDSANFSSNTHSISVNSNQLIIPGQKTLSIWLKSNRPLSTIDNWEVGFVNQGGIQGSMFGLMYGVGECQDLGFWGSGVANDMSVESTTNKWSSDENWHNAVITMDSSRNVRIYVDGESKQWLKHVDYVTKADFVTMPIDTTNYFVINSRGAWNSGFTYVNLDNVMLYNRALSASEVKQNFEALRGRYGI